MPFELLNRFKANQAIKSQSELSVSPSVQQELSDPNKTKLNLIDKLKARLSRPVALTDEENASAREQASGAIEANSLLSDASRRVSEHDARKEEEQEVINKLAQAGRVQELMKAAARGKFNPEKMSADALRQLSDQGIDLESEAMKLTVADMIRASQDSAKAELARREALGSQPAVDIGAERVRVAESETAQAEMKAYGARVVAAVESFGSEENVRARTEGDVDAITAANVLLKQESRNVQALRLAETRFVQQLTEIARLQVARGSELEVVQAQLDKVVGDNNQPRIEIKTLMSEVAPGSVDGQGALFLALSYSIRDTEASVFDSLPEQSRQAFYSSFGEISSSADGNPVCIPAEGTLAAEFSDNFARLQSLSEARIKATEIVKDHPEVADALYLLAMDEARVAQKLATQRVKLRSQVRLAIAEQKKLADAVVAQQMKDVAKLKKDEAKAAKYGKIRLTLAKKTKGALEWVTSQIQRAEDKVTSAQTSTEQAKSAKIDAVKNEQAGKITALVDLFQKGQMTQAGLEGAMQALVGDGVSIEELRAIIESSVETPEAVANESE